MAPSAHIEVAVCDRSNSSNFFGATTTAAMNLVNGATRPNIISVSYGYGEYIVDSASKTAIDLLWAQADAEGISVFVSSGDSGTNPSFNQGIIEEALIYSALLPAMDGGLAHHARKCLMQRERVRTCAGLATADQFPDGIDRPFPKNHRCRWRTVALRRRAD